MPSRNVVKEFVAEGVYHVYNRGANKKAVFFDKQDYRVFLSYIKEYLIPLDQKVVATALLYSKTASNKEKLSNLLRLKNYAENISLYAYCLMPNHFHLLVKQQEEHSLSQFLQSLLTRYTRYINSKYKRSGPVFGGTYKAARVVTDEQLVHVSRYIHRNPHILSTGLLQNENTLMIQPSSYPVYLNVLAQTWVNSAPVLSFFSLDRNNTYQSFVEDKEYAIEEKNAFILKDLTLDAD